MLKHISSDNAPSVYSLVCNTCMAFKIFISVDGNELGMCKLKTSHRSQLQNTIKVAFQVTHTHTQERQVTIRCVRFESLAAV
jgi:hypothetical protein